MHPDPEVVAEYVSDPHVVIGNTRARTANEVLRGFRSLQGKERLFALPVLAVHGSADATTSLEAVRNFVRRAGRGGGKGREGAGGGNATLREVEGGYHELMAAPGEREREAEEVARWVEALPAVVGAAAGGRGGGAGASVPSSRL
jgi:acylglycerol lipase